MHEGRSALVHALVDAVGLLDGGGVTRISPCPVNMATLKDFHSDDYLKRLRAASRASAAGVSLSATSSSSSSSSSSSRSSGRNHRGSASGSDHHPEQSSRVHLSTNERFGLVDDCPPFPRAFEHAAAIVGGSLAAANAVIEAVDGAAEARGDAGAENEGEEQLVDSAAQGGAPAAEPKTRIAAAAPIAINWDGARLCWVSVVRLLIGL